MIDSSYADSDKNAKPSIWKKVKGKIFKWLGRHWSLVVWYALASVLVGFAAHKLKFPNYLAYGLIAFTALALIVSPDKRRKRAIKWVGRNWALIVWYILASLLVGVIAYRAESTNYLAYGLISLTVLALIVSPEKRRKCAIKWISGNWSTALWYVLSVALVIGLAFRFDSWHFLISGMIALGVIALITRPIKSSAEVESDYPKDAVAVFRLGYVFVVLMVFLCIHFLLFYQTPYVLGSDGEFTGDAKYLNSTLAILPGCDYSVPGSERVASIIADQKEINEELADLTGVTYRRADMPEGAHCGELPPQWVLSIGGSILKCHIDGTCIPAKSKSEPRPAESGSATGPEKKGKSEKDSEPKKAMSPVKRASAGSDLVGMQSKLATTNAEIKATKAKIRKINLLNSAGATYQKTEWLKMIVGDKSKEAKQLTASIRATKARNAKSVKAKAEAKEAEKLENNIPGMPIIGGVVVPMYFIVMAIMGGLVNMVRKLPEYQARTQKDYDGKFELAIESGHMPRPPILVSQVPEYVVFQILQVLSAVAIAILAYSFARPEEIASSVVLAFGAGFSSEVVLMLIRATVDRLMGLGPRGPRISQVRKKIQKEREAIKAELLGDSSETILGGSRVSIGDIVKFKQEVNQHLVGTRAVVVGVTADGKLTVRVGRGAKAPEVTKPAEFFELVEDSSIELFTLQDDPVG